MGGGDLNSKKSWHPNTIKNQERVWKAEQAAAEEKKRIMELQHERAMERDRTELNDLARRGAGTSTDDNRLHWMYNKPDKQVQQEDYLLGKAIDKQYEQTDKAQEATIPAVARRIVGSSMLTMSADTQVDLARKIREDPLLLVKERERAARAALLNNPLQRKRLTELLRKEQDQIKEHKDTKKSKKKEKDLDNMLAAKLTALGGDKGIDLAKLLASDDSSSDSSEEDQKEKKKKKKKKAKKSKKSGYNSKKSKHTHESDSSEEQSDTKHRHKLDNNKSKYEQNSVELRKHKSDSSDYRDDKSKRSRSDHKTHDHLESDRHKQDSSGKHKRGHDSELHKDKKKSDKVYPSYKVTKKNYQGTPPYKNRRNSDMDSPPYKPSRNRDRESPPSKIRRKSDQEKGQKLGMSEKEKADKLAEMAAAGAERERDRAKRVADQRAADVADNKVAHGSRTAMRNEARALPDSLESRIHSNRHYIQRDKRHMNEHFARR